MAILRAVFLFFTMVILAMIFPQSSFAQRTFTFPRFDEQGYATVRVTGRASFRNLFHSVRQAAWMRGDLDAILATEEDLARENPGKVIHLCRSDGERPSLARDPAIFYEQCDPVHRARWLVQGVTYRIPLRNSTAPSVVAPHARAQHNEALLPSEQAAHGDHMASAESLANRSQDESSNLAEGSYPQNESSRDDGRVNWRDFSLAFLLALSALFLLFAFVYDRMQKRFSEAEKTIRKDAHAENLRLARELGAKDREIALLVESRLRLQSDRDAIRRAHDREQRAKNRMQQDYADLKDEVEFVRAQLSLAVKEAEGVQAELARDAELRLKLEEELLHAQQELGLQAARISTFAQTEQELIAHIRELQAQELTYRKHSEHVLQEAAQEVADLSEKNDRLSEQLENERRLREEAETELLALGFH